MEALEKGEEEGMLMTDPESTSDSTVDLDVDLDEPALSSGLKMDHDQVDETPPSHRRAVPGLPREPSQSVSKVYDSQSTKDDIQSGTMPSQTVPSPAKPSARLVIQKIVLVNFKSYYGRQEIGPFHKSFSAIVGPNGSGKSNTIDALLFVFGFKATKMRQGKLSELIHSSEGKHAPECSVEIWFREIIDVPGSEEFSVVDGSELVVARTAYRDNKSKYTIDSRTASYGEVQTLLKGRGIDLDHKRFLILQGEVESIAQMKPKGANANDEGLLEV